MEAVEEVFGTTRTWTVKELLALVDPGGPGMFKKPISLDTLPAELTEKLHRLGGDPMRLGKSLGRWLDFRDGRWAGTITIRRAGVDRTKTILWRLERAE